MRYFAAGVLGVALAALPLAARADTVVYGFRPVSNPSLTIGEITFTGPTISATAPWDNFGASIPGPVVTNFWFDMTSSGGPLLTMANILPTSHLNTVISNGPTLSGPGAPNDIVIASTVSVDVWFSIDSAALGSDTVFIPPSNNLILGDWVVVPAPGACVVLGCAGIVLVRRRRRAQP